jgi:hypothetical protein
MATWKRSNHFDTWCILWHSESYVHACVWANLVVIACGWNASYSVMSSNNEMYLCR